MNKQKIVIVGLCLLGFVSCKGAREEIFINEINGSWEKEKIQSFQFEIKDFENPRNIIFVVKNDDNYPYSNLRIISSLLGNEKEEQDTLNYLLAKPNGEWIGTGFGKVKETKFQYKLNYKFPSNGIYKIEVKQALRKDTLKGIEHFGIIIEQVQP